MPDVCKQRLNFQRPPIPFQVPLFLSFQPSKGHLRPDPSIMPGSGSLSYVAPAFLLGVAWASAQRLPRTKTSLFRSGNLLFEHSATAIAGAAASAAECSCDSCTSASDGKTYTPSGLKR